MMKICVLLYGLTGSGKSTFCHYVSSKHGFKTINLRRLFETTTGKDQAASLYHRLCEKYGTRTAWLDYISERIVEEIRNHQVVVIEGLFTKEEAEWFKPYFDCQFIIYLENGNLALRSARIAMRDGIDLELAHDNMNKSDYGRSIAGVTANKESADFVIINDSSWEDFHSKIEEIVYQIKNYPGLLNLCHHINKDVQIKFSVFDVVYYIRQLSIAYGCHNACSHCFSNSPVRISQTNLDGFQRIINEIGNVIACTHKALSFFHLGASTDPATVLNYSHYLKAWCNSMPEFQPIKVFTHGWNLLNVDQEKEMMQTLDVAKQRQGLKFVLSFDEFSLMARNNWEEYLVNVCKNLRNIIRAEGKSKVRIEVFYRPERNKCSTKCTLQYWRDALSINNQISFDEIINQCMNHTGALDLSCRKTTIGIIKVFQMAGLKPIDLIDMSRDCNMVFYAGRAKQLYTEQFTEDIQTGIEVQKTKVLYSLKNYEYRYDGIIIYPDGSARLVDYEGFKLKKFINNGDRVIPYMTKFNHNA